MRDIKIGIVLVNWNDSNNTIQALASVKQTNFTNLRIVVIDNHSSSKNITNLQGYLDKDTKLIINNDNYGLPYAANKGIEYLLIDSSITHIMWLNGEGRLAENFFQEIIPFIQKNRYLGIIATKNIYKISPKKSSQAYGMYLSRSGYPNIVVKENEHVSCPMGTIAIFSKEALESVKINNEFLASRFFLYAEDLDIGIRIQLAGYKWKLCKSALVYHTGWSFNGKFSDKAAYYLHRNILWFTIRCFPSKILLQNIIAIVFTHILTIGYYSIIKIKPLLILKAKYDGICGLRQAWRERKLIQKKTKITNSEFEKILSNRLLH